MKPFIIIIDSFINSEKRRALCFISLKVGHYTHLHIISGSNALTQLLDTDAALNMAVFDYTTYISIVQYTEALSPVTLRLVRLP